MKVFENVTIGNCVLKNRIIRSATFEGMCDKNGFPSNDYYKMYDKLSQNSIGGIITGFSYISHKGKAIHPGQAGIYSEKFIGKYKKLTNLVHKNKSKIFMQIAHTGRQTKKSVTGYEVAGISDKKSSYFNERPHILSKNELDNIVNDFVQSSFISKEAGFDGVQLHGAHGYLIHQSILPGINNRKDVYGIDHKLTIGTHFLSEIIDGIRKKCGKDFPILIKISGSDDYFNKFSKKKFINLIQFLDMKKIDAIEISYGTMDNALNIARGKIPIEVILNNNPIYKINNVFLKFIWKLLILPLAKLKVKKITPTYNLKFAQLAKEYTKIPIITVGGIRKGREITDIIENKNIDIVSLCRPFIAEPDFVNNFKKNNYYISKCISCNICFIMCDSRNSTKCYSIGEKTRGRNEIKQ